MIAAPPIYVSGRPPNVLKDANKDELIKNFKDLLPPKIRWLSGFNLDS